MQKGLVSIITPCYNTGDIVHRLLDSILLQDYPFVEMFAIDDGSTDCTTETIRAYIPKFQDKGYQLTYIYQPNSGQSVAINNGLKMVNGEFLLWPDSDDFYNNETAISTFVINLEKTPSANMVRCYPTYVDENTLKVIDCTKDSTAHHKEDLFLDSLLCLNGFFWGAGNYMIRLSAFDKNVWKREIYTEKTIGQNWQLISPMLYKQQCITLKTYFINILVRKSSHSRGQFCGYEKVLQRENAYERTILETLIRMPQLVDTDRQFYTNKVKLHYIHQRMIVALGHQQSKAAVDYAKQFDAQSPKRLSPVVHLMCRFCDCSPLFFVLRVVRKVLNVEL